MNKPRVLLLDEPLGALDLKLRKQMQLELKAIQHDVGITFVHVTHDQEEAMTMADGIAVMNAGRIEQLGAPAELYERPRTAFVAGFLGISNLLSGHRQRPRDRSARRGHRGARPPEALDGRTGKVAVGVRPEKIRVGHGEENRLDRHGCSRPRTSASRRSTSSRRGPATSACTSRTASPAHRDQAPAEISWSPDSTFVVDSTEGAE